VRRGLGGLRPYAFPSFYVPNITAYPSTASVPITVVLLYDSSLLCSFNVGIKGLRWGLYAMMLSICLCLSVASDA